MKTDIAAIIARVNRPLSEGGNRMWYLAFIDTMLDVLKLHGSFDHDMLAAELQRRLALYDPALEKDRQMHEALTEALAQLEAHRPA